MEISKVFIYLVLMCSVTESTYSGLEQVNLQHQVIKMESEFNVARDPPNQKLEQNHIAQQKKTHLIADRLANEETSLEGLLTQMNELSNKLSEVQKQVDIAMKKDSEITTQQLVRTNENLLKAIDRLSQVISFNLTNLNSTTEAALERFEISVNLKLTKQSSLLEDLRSVVNKLVTQQMQSNQILSQMETSVTQRKIWKQIQKLTTQKDLAQFKVRSGLDLQKISFRSCKEEPSKESGKYLIRTSDVADPFIGYCDQFNFGGGWLVIQHRFNGSLDFYRNWTEYRNGFGSVDSEYWLGLEYLYQMTSQRYFELLVELEDFEGNYIYARYDDFEISSESTQYSLKLGSYTGTAGDSLHWHRNMKFTTQDRDNDNAPGSNCAIEYEAAWWYNYCHHSHLNGVYGHGEHPKYITWHPYKSSYIGLAYSRMLIRQL